MRLHFLTFLLAFHFSSAQSTITYQGEKINELDSGNNKIGLWKLYDHDRGIVVSGTMQNDEFVSDIEYIQYGKLIAQQNGKNLILHKGEQQIKGKIEYGEKTKIVADEGNIVDSETALQYFKIAEMKPLFYGGSVALSDFLLTRIDRAKIKNHHGKVKVKFTVDADGFVVEPEVSESSDPFLNDKALRLVKSLPRFQPGFQQGKFVKVRYTIPISF